MSLCGHTHSSFLIGGTPNSNKLAGIEQNPGDDAVSTYILCTQAFFVQVEFQRSLWSKIGLAIPCEREPNKPC